MIRHEATGLDVEQQTTTFENAWNATLGTDRDENVFLKRKNWEELLVPLPGFERSSWAYAMTYRDHQKEVRQEKIFFFEKSGLAEGAWLPIRHRAMLDYEAEIALLLHRQEPDRFGFLFANDLTDRAVQLRTFNRRNPAPGFTEAKSFPGALRVGPLLVIGSHELWPKLEVELWMNGGFCQRVNARECLLTPRDFHRQIFARDVAKEWALVASGTTGGTIFRSPGSREKLWLLIKNGFSIRRAREDWLRRFHFLEVGDRLEMKSEVLGTSYATIVATTEQY